MNEQVFAWLVIASFWVFFITPLFISSGYSRYSEDVKTSIALNALLVVFISMVMLLFWAIAVVFK